MEPATTFASILPSLSIGVVAILALVFALTVFIKVLRELIENNQQSLDRHVDYQRGLEKEIRGSIMVQLTENTQAFRQVMAHFNGENTHR